MIDETLLEAEEKMEKAVEVAKEDFAGIRTGRATPGMFNKLMVDYYGAMTPIIQLASLTVPEPRMAVITPYDKSSLGLIERAIRDSDPRTNPEARKLDEITYSEALQQGLRVVDAAAFSLCMENGLPIVVFALQEDGNIGRAVRGEKIGTLVSGTTEPGAEL